MRQDVVLGMVGAGGDGVIAAGDTLLSSAALDGLYARILKSFGPQIRGGESSCRLRVSAEKIHSAGGMLDVLVLLNWDVYPRFKYELPVKESGIILYESAGNHKPEDIKPTGNWKRKPIPVPFTEIAVKTTGKQLAKNLVALGIVSELYNIAPEKIKGGIIRRFSKKGEEVVQSNLAAFNAGRSWVKENLTDVPVKRLSYTPSAPKMIINGDHAAAAGAIFAGCDFFGGYPITPASEVMEFMTRELPKYNATFVQAEDEIAAIGMCVGASFAGAKPFTATSGPGMSLKTEIIGLATMAELPLVIVNVQRGGPSTGMPTKSEQSDLLQAVFSAHGDAPRPVLAAPDIAENFTATVEAFNIAEEYQTPVIMLTDAFLGQGVAATDKIDTSNLKLKYRRVAQPGKNGEFKRFLITDDFISPVAIPGTPGMQYLASGIEHNEKGSPMSDVDIHHQMNRKRVEKLNPLKKRADLFLRYGNPKARWGVLSWGGSAGAVIDAVSLGKEIGVDFKALIPILINPVPEKAYEEFFETLDGLLVVEQSYTAQLYRFLKGEIKFPNNVKTFTKSGGSIFMPDEIVEKVKEMQNG
ncbi:MAG: 2-oxoacid:acceptor oxidoreductase subunit alpha [Myxococcota bacterium]